MAVITGEKYKVYIEDKNGKVMEIPAVAVSISTFFDGNPIYEYGDPRGLLFGIQRTRIELEAVEAPVWIERKKWEVTVEAKSTAQEWKCDFCGRPNQRQDEKCKSCGAVRSFIYG